MAYYVVKQGDHLSSIAHDNGFSDYNTIWNDSNNADLKKQRVDPNILFPNDNLFIPDLQQKEYDKASGARYTFQAKIPKLKLRITLHDADDKPLANVKCQLNIESNSVEVTSDANGTIEQPLQPTDKTASLAFTDPNTTFYDSPIPIKIGELDPIDTVSGQVARLFNLGYFLGDPDSPDPADIQSAIEEFQCDNSLQVDGKCGSGTQSKLKDIHGC